MILVCLAFKLLVGSNGSVDSGKSHSGFDVISFLRALFAAEVAGVTFLTNARAGASQAKQCMATVRSQPFTTTPFFNAACTSATNSLRKSSKL